MTHISEADQVLELLAALPADIRSLALANLKRWANRDPHSGPFGWQLGLRYVERAPGRVTAMMEIDEALHNPGQVAHGGVMFTLADSAMGAATFTLLEPGQRCTTAELKLNYIAPIIKGKVTATATVISKRRRLAVVTAEVRDEQGELVGLAQGTFAIIRGVAERPIEGDS
ncbi:MAG: PaaI family thioesterase [Chloroflexi bacterium]|nr:PaaI family thioesterase [Chloroflexota bacterium]